jgi:hypothetical protein
MTTVLKIDHGFTPFLFAGPLTILEGVFFALEV